MIIEIITVHIIVLLVDHDCEVNRCTWIIGILIMWDNVYDKYGDSRYTYIIALLTKYYYCSNGW